MSSAAPTLVIYDPDCGLCTKTMKFVKLCDWLGRMQAMDYYTAAKIYPDVAAHELDEGMQLRYTDGRLLVGFPAARATMMNTIAGALVGWVFYIPPMPRLGTRLYRWVADRRKAGACAIEP
ncbi:MAG: DUF393 domain-containing protein [Thermoleophilia bacterium]|nr:DUF393 domain-containing protein [Thermoleophilia bacterium]